MRRVVRGPLLLRLDADMTTMIHDVLDRLREPSISKSGRDSKLEKPMKVLSRSDETFAEQFSRLDVVRAARHGYRSAGSHADSSSTDPSVL